jgi:hypothetical protein
MLSRYAGCRRKALYTRSGDDGEARAEQFAQDADGNRVGEPGSPLVQ